MSGPPLRAKGGITTAQWNDGKTLVEVDVNFESVDECEQMRLFVRGIKGM